MANKKHTKSEIIIPDGWQYLPFGHVFEFVQSLSLSREQLTSEQTKNNIYSIHYGDIHATYNADVLDFNKEKRIPKIKDEAITSKAQPYLKNGDLIIADASEDYEGVGSCIEILNLNDKKAIGGLHTFVARDISGLTIPGFRPYVFKHPVVTNELKKLATGSKVYGVSKTNLASLYILIPPHYVQLKIKKVLSAFNEAIEKQTQLILSKENQKKAVMRGFLSGDMRFKEHKKLKIRRVALGEILKIKHGRSQKGIEDPNGKFPILGTGGIMGRTNSFLWDKPSVLIGRKGTIDKPQFMNTPFWTVDTLFYTDIKDNVHPEWLYQTFLMIDWKNYNEASGVPSLSASTIAKIEINMPVKDEQIKIAKMLLAMDNEMNKLRIQLKEIVEQKEGVLQQLLTGKIKLKK